MDGSVSNVQFTERKRGHDPEEVANYLQQVDEKIAGLKQMAGEAVDRAEAAEGAAAQARRLLSEAEERAAAAERKLTERDAAREDDSARAASILSMAQRTADATTADAEERARATLAEVEQRAAEQRAEVEVETERLMADARRQAEVMRSEGLTAVREEIAELQSRRDELSVAVDALTHHLDDERSKLRAAVGEIERLLDDPAGFQPATPPEVPKVEIPHEAEAEPEQESAAGAGTVTGAGDQGGTDQSELDQSADVVDQFAAPAAATGGAPEDPVSGLRGAPGRDLASAWAKTVSDEHPDAPAEPAAPPPPVEAGPPERPVTETTFDDPGPPTHSVPLSDLFGEDTEPPFEEPSRPYGLFSESNGDEESPLGPPDEQADAAMRAFFEEDAEGVPERQQPRWGRRRR